MLAASLFTQVDTEQHDRPDTTNGRNMIGPEP